MRKPDYKREPVSAYLCAAVVALVLRIYQLGAESLWIDEGFSLRDAADPDVLSGNRPLYFLFLNVWLGLGGGRSEFLLRLPSALFGVAGVWALYAVGRRLIGARPALLASGFMAISVLHVNHSQEVRMYSLTVLCVLLATYFLLAFLERGRAGYLAGYVVSALGALLAFPLTVLVLMAHGLFLLMYIRASRPRSFVLLGSQLAVAAAWVPWLLNNMRETSGYGEGYTLLVDKPTPLGIIDFLGRFFLWKWNDPGGIVVIGIFGFSAGVLALALYGLRGFRRSDAGPALAWLWLVVPVISMVILSYGLANMWMVHYLIAASPALYLLVSRGIFSLRNRYIAGTAVLVVTILTLGRLGVYYMKPARAQWSQAVSYIQANEHPGDVISIYFGGNEHVFRYYYHGNAKWSRLGKSFSSSEDFAGWNEAKVEELLSSFPVKGDRLWLVLSHHTFRGGFNIINYMKSRYRVLDHKAYHLLELYLFDANGRPLPTEVRRKQDKQWTHRHN